MPTNVNNPTAQAQIQYLEQVAASGVDPEQKAFAQGILANIQGLPEAEVVAVLSEIFGIAPGSNNSPDVIRQQMDHILARYDAIASGEIGLSDNYSNLTPEDAAMAIAKLAVEMAFKQQQDARDRAIAARDTRVALLTAQAGEMFKEADSMRAAAMSQLILGCVSGIVSIAGGVLSAYSSWSSMNIQSAQADSATASKVVDVEQGQLNSLNHQRGIDPSSVTQEAIDQQQAAVDAANKAALEQSQNHADAIKDNRGWATMENSVGQLSGGVAKGLDSWSAFVGTTAEADQTDMRARGKLLEAAAEIAGTEKDVAEKIEQSNQQFALAMMDNLQKIQEAQNVRLAI